MSNQDKRERLAKRLNEYLAVNNLSGRELARRLKLNPTSVNNYLQAVSLPDEENRAAIAALLGITPKELEADLEASSLKPERDVERIKRDIRLLDRQEFLDVAEAVMERLLSETRAQLSQTRPTKG